MKKKYTYEYVTKPLNTRRKIKPTGRLFMFGRYLSAEETANYLGANKDTNT